VSLTDVKVYSQNGLLLAKLPLVEVYYNWHWQEFSFEKFNFKELAYIERLYLKDGEFFVRREDTQFDLMPILKVQADGQPHGFAGLLELDSAQIDLTRAWNFNTDIIIEEVDGTINFQNADKIAIDLTGTFETAPLAVSGGYSPQNGEIFLENKTPVNLTAINFKRLFPARNETFLQEILLEKVAFAAKPAQTPDAVWEIKADGEFSGLTMNEPAQIRAGRGRFALAGPKLIFSGLALEIAGLAANGGGELLVNSSDLSASELKFAIALPSVDPAKLSAQLVGENPLQLDAAIAGTLKEPTVTGKFKLPRLDLDNIPVSNINGEFDYNSAGVFLKAVTGESLGGKITAAGELFLDSRTCELNIAGYGLDSFIILGKDFKGALDFNAHLSSRAATTITRGNFIVRDGYAYGAPFQVFNGFFVKQDGKSDITDVAIRTRTGNIYPGALNQEAFKGSLP
ncbi:MAG: hypothetical protein LBR56_02205, partial [Sporomusaceae bacterium]|jgi:hypothetical protein|nr:hypothetical protein [Sporomusaceae bacterium]